MFNYAHFLMETDLCIIKQHMYKYLIAHAVNNRVFVVKCMCSR